MRVYFAALLVGVFVGVVVVGCSSTPSVETPAGALSLFLAAMDRSAEDPGALRAAYLLLDKRARQQLQLRARKAETLAGRDLMPWEMLAEGRFRLRFAPAARGGMRAKVTGNRAEVIVTGSAKGQQVKVPMVREPEGWRVELAIPELQSNP